MLLVFKALKQNEIIWSESSQSRVLVPSAFMGQEDGELVRQEGTGSRRVPELVSNPILPGRGACSPYGMEDPRAQRLG